MTKKKLEETNPGLKNILNNKNKPGGARIGAGRKDPVTKVRVNFTINETIAEKLKSETNQSGLVERLLRDYYKIFDEE